MEPSTDQQPVQLSFPLPRSLDTKVHLRLTTQAKAITLFVTTVAADDVGNPVPIGSFVYAMPDRYNPNQPLATTLYAVEPTLEFTTRLARLLAKKTRMPVYVGNSISLANTGLGGTVEEEMEVFAKVVEVALDRLKDVIARPEPLTNGAGSS